ncbi:MAG: hypothetical protein M0009_06050 [Deltaproteobacteria bacterium]|nr:hypothetical protein [Deltaproteobacteria bacterium]
MIAAKKCSCAVLVLLLLLLQGCASQNKALINEDLRSINQVRSIRYQFDGYMKETTGANITSLLVATPFMLFGAIGGGIGGALYASVKDSMMLSAGKEMQSKCNLPDFTELVQKRFSERLPQSIPAWPQMIVETNAVDKVYENKSDCLLSISTRVVVSDDNGLQTQTIAQLVHPARDVLWKKIATYTSSEANHPCKIEELEADNGKLLNEEVGYAVEKTVVALLDHLKNGDEIKEPAPTQQSKPSETGR